MVTFYKHPPFDNRIYSLTFPIASQRAGGLTRGYMAWHEVPPGYNKRTQQGQVRFLYNPSTVSTSYSLMTDKSGLAAMEFRTVSDRANPLIPINQSTSFDLLYDRTFELWGSYKNDGTPVNDGGVNDPRTEGVGVDILAMKQFTGMLTYAPSGKGNANNSTPPVQQGPMLLVQSWVYFGSPNGIYYFGYVTDWTVQVTHWTQYMVPMRCVISVNFALLPAPKKTSPTDTKWWMLNEFPKRPGPGPVLRPGLGTPASLSTTASGRAGR